MDGFYRGLETSLLGLAFLLGLGAFLLPPLTEPPRATSLTVTLPMITVTSDQ